MTWVAIIVGIVSVVLSTSLSYYQSEQAAEEATKARKEQEEQANKQYALAKENAARQKKAIEKQEFEAEKLQSETERTREQTAMRNRKRRGLGELTTQSTILTSPLGVVGNQNAGAQKTLLGE